MYMNLKCPNCGFSFGAGFDDDEPEEIKREIMTCPCGTMMEQVEKLEFNVFRCDINDI